uniref:Uncharacterized protein n=1 Tax=Amphimedon queenslandica TaxID=400682 RepID=A0A1X7UL22_AMPQE
MNVGCHMDRHLVKSCLVQSCKIT